MFEVFWIFNVRASWYAFFKELLQAFFLLEYIFASFQALEIVKALSTFGNINYITLYTKEGRKHYFHKTWTESIIYGGTFFQKKFEAL